MRVLLRVLKLQVIGRPESGNRLSVRYVKGYTLFYHRKNFFTPFPSGSSSQNEFFLTILGRSQAKEGGKVVEKNDEFSASASHANQPVR